MKADDIIQNAQKHLDDYPDRQILLDFLELGLQELSDAEDWSFFLVHANPIAKTFTGKREYELPENFGSNFIVDPNDDGSRRLLKISNGSTESHLEFVPSGGIYSNDFASASNSLPTQYSIATNPVGRKLLVLEPPPDANSSTHYTLRGVYKAAFHRVERDSWIPVEPRSYLLYDLLARVDPRGPWGGRLSKARTDLYMEEARNRKSQLVPRMDDFPGRDGWELSRRQY